MGWSWAPTTPRSSCAARPLTCCAMWRAAWRTRASRSPSARRAPAARPSPPRACCSPVRMHAVCACAHSPPSCLPRPLPAAPAAAAPHSSAPPPSVSHRRPSPPLPPPPLHHHRLRDQDGAAVAAGRDARVPGRHRVWEGDRRVGLWPRRRGPADGRDRARDARGAAGRPVRWHCWAGLDGERGGEARERAEGRCCCAPRAAGLAPSAPPTPINHRLLPPPQTKNNQKLKTTAPPSWAWPPTRSASGTCAPRAASPPRPPCAPTPARRLAPSLSRACSIPPALRARASFRLQRRSTVVRPVPLARPPLASSNPHPSNPPSAHTATQRRQAARTTRAEPASAAWPPRATATWRWAPTTARSGSTRTSAFACEGLFCGVVVWVGRSNCWPLIAPYFFLLAADPSTPPPPQEPEARLHLHPRPGRAHHRGGRHLRRQMARDTRTRAGSQAAV